MLIKAYLFKSALISGTFSLEINLRFRGFVVKNWNVPFTVEDFHESKQSVMRWF